jgi:hypothetical protein
MRCVYLPNGVFQVIALRYIILNGTLTNTQLYYTYRLSQEEMSILIFWEVTESAILSKKCICTCALFGTVSEIELFHYTVFWIWRQILSFPPAYESV